MAVKLADGTYAGVGNRNLTFNAKTLAVRSQSNEAQRCTLDCQGSDVDPGDPEARRGFVFEAYDVVYVRGITVYDGVSHMRDYET